MVAIGAILSLGKLPRSQTAYTYPDRVGCDRFLVVEVQPGLVADELLRGVPRDAAVRRFRDGNGRDLQVRRDRQRDLVGVARRVERDPGIRRAVIVGVAAGALAEGHERMIGP